MELRGKRVMVTGGEGFLGSRLVAQLQEAGADVFVDPRERLLYTQAD